MARERTNRPTAALDGSGHLFTRNAAWAAMLALGLLSLACGSPASAQRSTQDVLPYAGFRWMSVFGASPTDPQPGVPAAQAPTPVFNNQTVRQVVHLSAGTPFGLRIRLSNALSGAPITFSDVHVARWAGSPGNPTSAIIPGTDVGFTFNEGQTSVTVPPYGEVVSDAVTFPVNAGTDLTVSLYVPTGNTTPATQHFLGNTTVYYAAGDVSAATTLSGAGTYTNRPYISSVEIATYASGSTIVTLGDSITDGAYSTPDGNTRWPDFLSTRLLAAYGNALGISNAGVGSGTVLTDNYGLSFIARLNRDVLTVPGVKYVVVFGGVNDIYAESALTPAQLEAGYRAIIARCHELGIAVYGATLTPIGGSFIYSPAREALRQAVNGFIRTSGAFDAVIDFDKAIADPRSPVNILAAYNSDSVHPNNAGYQAMANFIDLSLFNPNTH